MNRPRTLRILHLGNTNNIGYFNVKFLRQASVEADLVFDPTDHVSYQPAWVEPSCNVPWVRSYSSRLRHGLRLDGLRVPVPYGHRLAQAWDVATLVRHYDIVQAYNYDVILCLIQKTIPIVAYCVGGDLNVSARGSTWVGALLRAAYRRAAAVLYSNIDMRPAVDALGLPNARYIPLPVDTSLFCPSSPEEHRDYRRVLSVGDDFVCFSPTRHDWRVKGNDRLIQAWAQVVARCRGRGLGALLVLSEWGPDVEQSRKLVDDLGVTLTVRWVPLVNKRLLRDWYLAADVVADQFILKAFGLVTLEAMACGRPVVGGVDLGTAGEFYVDPPPVVSARSVREIAEALEHLLEDEAARKGRGQASRSWVAEYHGPDVVVREHLSVYAEILGNAGYGSGRP